MLILNSFGHTISIPSWHFSVINSCPCINNSICFSVLCSMFKYISLAAVVVSICFTACTIGYFRFLLNNVDICICYVALMIFTLHLLFKSHLCVIYFEMYKLATDLETSNQSSKPCAWIYSSEIVLHAFIKKDMNF